MEFAWESVEISGEEGMVEEELRRAEDAALPYGAVEAELFVPPLPLEQKVSLIMIRPGHEKKRCHTGFCSRLCWLENSRR